MNQTINPSVYANVEQLSKEFQNAQPYSYLVIDNFLDETIANKLIEDFPKVEEMPKSRDYMFGNKHELSSLQKSSPYSKILFEEIASNEFQSFISKVTGENLFLDVQFHGGGFHQGTNGSFLNMHTDFNIHPEHKTWLRRLNLLIYLNKDWKPEYGGELRLRLGKDGEITAIPPNFNRCVIMRSDDTTFHGYQKINLPPQVTRKSIAAYFYRQEVPENLPSQKTTIWDPEDGVVFKRVLATVYNPLVLIKNRFLGSSTARNR